MSSAIIDIHGDVSSFQQKFYIKKLIKESKSLIQFENKTIPIYRMPVSLENPSEKAMKKFILYLKKENISHIILSKKAESVSISSLLKESFKEFDGTEVINYKIYDILRKCATGRKIDLTSCSLLLDVNSPQRAKNIILKTYKHVRKIKIQTEDTEAFSELCDYFLKEYGLFIEVSNQIHEKDIEINVDQKEKKADIDLENGKSEIIFAKGSLFIECKPYHELNQSMIEFLINCFYGRVCRETIKKFFSDYPVRISKIKFND